MKLPKSVREQIKQQGGQPPEDAADHARDRIAEQRLRRGLAPTVRNEDEAEDGEPTDGPPCPATKP